MKLFAVYIGGEHPAAHIEVPDIRFHVAATLRDTYDRLRAEWWGTAGTLHIDCWAEIDHADGHDVELRRTTSTTREKLYFVNLGGYDGKAFAEQHRNMFVVATSVKEAKARALATVTDWTDAHRDDIYQAEQVFALDSLFGDGWSIHLTPSDRPAHPKFTCRYIPLR